MTQLETVWTGNVHAAQRGYLCVPVHPIVSEQIGQATGLPSGQILVALQRLRREGSLVIVKLTGAARKASGWTAYRVPA